MQKKPHSLLVLVSPSNIIINHVAVKFTVIWFPMNKFTQPALLYCMNETDGSINSSVVTCTLDSYSVTIYTLLCSKKKKCVNCKT